MNNLNINPELLNLVPHNALANSDMIIQEIDKKTKGKTKVNEFVNHEV
jgi:hypothetical protein